ncbi:MAG: hypothetical protein HYX86_04100 [Chloroflexi bacterium]|nr:hypothetical protein [Chloroflexota bacterium]
MKVTHARLLAVLFFALALAAVSCSAPRRAVVPTATPTVRIWRAIPPIRLDL